MPVYSHINIYHSKKIYPNITFPTKYLQPNSMVCFSETTPFANGEYIFFLLYILLSICFQRPVTVGSSLKRKYHLAINALFISKRFCIPKTPSNFFLLTEEHEYLFFLSEPCQRNVLASFDLQLEFFGQPTIK